VCKRTGIRMFGMLMPPFFLFVAHSRACPHALLTHAYLCVISDAAGARMSVGTVNTVYAAQCCTRSSASAVRTALAISGPLSRSWMTCPSVRKTIEARHLLARPGSPAGPCRTHGRRAVGDVRQQLETSIGDPGRATPTYPSGKGGLAGADGKG